MSQVVAGGPRGSEDQRANVLQSLTLVPHLVPHPAPQPLAWKHRHWLETLTYNALTVPQRDIREGAHLRLQSLLLGHVTLGK